MDVVHPVQLGLYFRTQVDWDTLMTIFDGRDGSIDAELHLYPFDFARRVREEPGILLNWTCWTCVTDDDHKVQGVRCSTAEQVHVWDAGHVDELVDHPIPGGKSSPELPYQCDWGVVIEAEEGQVRALEVEDSWLGSPLAE